MNPWIGKTVFLVGLVVFVAIRVPPEKRSKQTRTIESRRGALEVLLLTLMTIAVFPIPLIYVFSPLFSLADYPLRPLPFVGGLASLVLSLWLFHRSHSDLGANWSGTLEIRENHGLVTSGIYRSIRHPMYASIFVYAIGQALLLPNWIAGPSCFAGFMLMFVCRVRAEERMMLDRFGAPYKEYMARTKRLIPGIW